MNEVCLRVAELKTRSELIRQRIHYFQRLNRVYEYLDGNFDTRFHIEKAAAVAGLSRSAFSRHFKRSVGLTFHQFLLLEGIRRAIELIERSDAKILAVALEAGFGNLPILERHFKSRLGITPSRYRDLYLGNGFG